MKELGKYLLGTLQTFRFAALPVCGCVRFVEPLDATPSEGADFDCFAGHGDHATTIVACGTSGLCFVSTEKRITMPAGFVVLRLD
jgi:hypothetical protein